MSRSRTLLHAKEREDLSQRLWEWAGVEMGLSGDFLPSQEELKMYEMSSYNGEEKFKCARKQFGSKTMLDHRLYAI